MVIHLFVCLVLFSFVWLSLSWYFSIVESVVVEATPVSVASVAEAVVASSPVAPTTPSSIMLGLGAVSAVGSAVSYLCGENTVAVTFAVVGVLAVGVAFLLPTSVVLPAEEVVSGLMSSGSSGAGSVLGPLAPVASESVSSGCEVLASLESCEGGVSLLASALALVHSMLFHRPQGLSSVQMTLLSCRGALTPKDFSVYGSNWINSYQSSGRSSSPVVVELPVEEVVVEQVPVVVEVVEGPVNGPLNLVEAYIDQLTGGSYGFTGLELTLNRCEAISVVFGLSMGSFAPEITVPAHMGAVNSYPPRGPGPASPYQGAYWAYLHHPSEAVVNALFNYGALNHPVKVAAFTPDPSYTGVHSTPSELTYSLYHYSLEHPEAPYVVLTLSEQAFRFANNADYLSSLFWPKTASLITACHNGTLGNPPFTPEFFEKLATSTHGGSGAGKIARMWVLSLPLEVVTILTLASPLLHPVLLTYLYTPGEALSRMEGHVLGHHTLKNAEYWDLREWFYDYLYRT